MDELHARIANIQQKKLSGDSVYRFLLYFDKLYDKFADKEKKEFMHSFLERVEIYPDRQEDGRILRHIDFRFPVFFEGQEVDMINWDSEKTVETVVLLSHKKPDSVINVKVEFGEGEGKIPLDNHRKESRKLQAKRASNLS